MNGTRLALTLTVLTLALAACGTSPGPSGATAPSSSARSPTDVPTGRTVRLLHLSPESVTAFVKSDPATAKKWGADPANAMNVLPAFRHILVKAPAGDAAARAAAKKKAEEIIARLDRGEDFATLAKTSDDPGSANKGGAYPGRQVKMFVAEMRSAYAALRPGERGKAPVESQFGWHVVAKGPVDDEASVDGHPAWLARNMVERIGRDLTKRLRHVERGAVPATIEKAFLEVLGAPAKDEPAVVLRMTAEACDGFATVARGEGISWRDDVLVVAALTDDERDDGEVDAEGCEDRMSEARVADLTALLKRTAEASKPDMTSWVATPAPKARPLAIVRLEDAVEAVRAVAHVPPDTALSFERVGEGNVFFLHFKPGPKEKEADVLTRARSFVATMKHPPQMSFVLEPMQRDGGAFDGYRTFLARDEVVIDEKDVAKATTTTRGDDVSVVVELRPEGAKRLSELSQEMLNRRIAILVDGVVVVAPIVKSALTAGRFEMPMDGATPAAKKAKADRLAKSLSRR